MSTKAAALAGALLITGLLAAPSVHAQSDDRYSLRGFGGWAYGNTNNDNAFGYVASDLGDWNNYDFALNLAAQPMEKLSIRTQAFWGDDQRGQRVRLDYVFAEWAENRAFKVRAGKTPVPFGIYTEVYDVGTVRPFYLLPQFYEGPLGFIPKAYLGVGVTGATSLGENWELQYDGFGGEIHFEPFNTDFVSGAIDPGTGLPVIRTMQSQIVGREMIGGRVLLQSPAKGFDVGGTVFHLGDVRQSIEGGELRPYSVTDQATFLNARAQYQRGKFAARSEWFGILARDADVKSVYVEASYKFAKHWQVAGQYENSKLVLPATDQSVPDALRHHESFGLALNFWLSPEVVVKLNGYHVDGNLIARPDQAGLRAVLGTIDQKTNVVVAGVQFSF
jgi:hypothetical protein